MSRRARQLADSRPWGRPEAFACAPEDDDEPTTGDWSDGCGDGQEDEQEQQE